MPQSLSFVITVFFELRGPESEVVSDQLHNSGGIFVLVLLDLVDVSNRIIEGLLGELAGFGGIVLDFVEEDGVVESQTESAGVGGLEILLSLISGSLIGLLGSVSVFLSLGSGGVFGDVSVVVSLHLVVEDQGLSVGSLGDELAVDEVEDLIAELVEFSLNLGLVGSEETDVLGALLFFLLLDGGECSPGSSSGSDGVLVGDGEEVSLFDVEVGVGSNDSVHGFEHVLKPFGLFGDFGHVEMFFPGVCCHFRYI